MRIAYFDCFSGVSGDMCLGALVDAGVPLKGIEEELKNLPVGGYRLSAKKVKRSGLAATKVDVAVSGASKRPAMRWADIDRVIEDSSLSGTLKEKGRKIFRLIFSAEARVHGERLKKVHLHELGAVDCLVDIFGTLIGLELLGIKKAFASALNLGSGLVRTDHGLLPVPAPATAELVRGVPVYSSNIPFELTTPTGAALMRTLSESFGEMPLFAPERTGTGAGSREMERFPNVLRLFIGEMKPSPAGRVTVIETNIDDMNPQVYGYLMERLMGMGALDVFLTNVMMKKMRPGIKLSVLCAHEDREALIDTILKETTSIGVRYYETPRVTMKREMNAVKTKFGTVMVKVSKGRHAEKSVPEYEDCRKIAQESGAPLIEVMEEAKRAAAKRRSS
jgi:uncharacterized protein (TIGR00299 family) protein